MIKKRICRASEKTFSRLIWYSWSSIAMSGSSNSLTRYSYCVNFNQIFIHLDCGGQIAVAARNNWYPSKFGSPLGNIRSSTLRRKLAWWWWWKSLERFCYCMLYVIDPISVCSHNKSVGKWLHTRHAYGKSIKCIVRPTSFPLISIPIL